MTEVATDATATELARSVAIIMDGNGRWAERRGLPVAEGHRAGTRALRRTVEAAIDLGVRSLAVYDGYLKELGAGRADFDTLMREVETFNKAHADRLAPITDTMTAISPPQAAGRRP